MASTSVGGNSERVFSRRVVPVEAWYRAFPRALSPVLNLVIEGTGGIDPEDLRKAVATAGEVFPGSQLVPHGKREWIDRGVPAAVRLEPQTFAVEARALQRPLPAGDAYCEAVLFDGAIVFRASHAVMDARGLRLWAGEVFRALRGEEPSAPDDGRTVLDLDEPLLEPVGDDGKDAGKPARVPSLLGTPRGAGAGVRWHRRTLDGIYPALVARIATELARLAAVPTATIAVPVDLREFHRDVRSTSNFATSLNLDITGDWPWEATHHKLMQGLWRREAAGTGPGPEVLGMPPALLRALIRFLDRRARRTDLFDDVANVSNMGRVDAAEFGTPEFEPTAVVLLGPREPAGSVNVNAVECDGRTELTMAWWSGEDIDGRAEHLLDELCESLSPAAHRAHGTLLPAPVDVPGAVPADRGVVEQFRDQVAARPDAVAVTGPGGDTTYAELDRRARAIAGELVRHGVRRGHVVGLLADRSVDAVAGAWGVLMAGAAYLPMDTKHPDERIRDLLEDAGAPCCLVGRRHGARDCLPGGCAPLVLDDLAQGDAGSTPIVLPRPDDLAYVVYTSGSTGRPKGVEIEHRSLSNYAAWATREHGIDASCRMPLLCSLSFDVAEISLILPFLVGGRVLLMRDELSRVSLQEMFDAGATTIALTPSHLDLITRLDLTPRSVRELLVIGEEFPRSLAVRARAMFGPDCRIINLYGPAEATIGVSHHLFDAGVDAGPSVPIGVPLDGVTMHLLDGERRFAAPGEISELYIGGVQLARGYRGRTDLTRQRFVRLADGSRVYRTGDLVRRLASGELEYCGRIDDQVKIHGHRIEPAEISRTLEAHPSVAAAVVVPRSPGAGRAKELHGYVVPAVGTDVVDVAELRAHLAKTLPSYMVPAVLMVVTAVPRTVNGKVDVAALPSPATGPLPRDPGGTLDETGQAVAKIWAEVLDVDADDISGGSDFHRLGGNSLSMIAMVAAIGRDLVGPAREGLIAGRMVELIAEPTVERVARVVREVRAGGDTFI